MALYVNGEKIDAELIAQEIERLRPSYEQVFVSMPEQDRQAQLAEWSRENVIEAVLLRQQAAREFPVIDEAAVQRQLDQLLQAEADNGPIHQRLDAGAEQEAILRDQIAEQIRHQQIIEKVTSNLPEVNKSAIEKNYHKNIDRFTIPEMVHAAHIVKHPSPDVTPEQAKEQIDAIYQQIQDGAEFEQLAGSDSDCPDQNGDLGFFARGKMVPGFEEAVFNLEPGTCSEPFLTEFGWHIAKVYEKRPAAPCPIEQVREVIVKDLQQKAAEKAIEQFIDAQKAKATIEER